MINVLGIDEQNSILSDISCVINFHRNNYLTAELDCVIGSIMLLKLWKKRFTLLYVACFKAMLYCE